MANLLKTLFYLDLRDFATITVSNIIEQSYLLVTRWSAFEMLRKTTSVNDAG